MGCCFSRKDIASHVELSKSGQDITNDTLTCKLGVRGEKIKVFAGENGFNVVGSGMVLGSCPLDCDTARWEVVIQKLDDANLSAENPTIQIGVLRFNPKQSKLNLNCSLMENENSKETPAWCLKGVSFTEGDVIGVYWDQTDLPMLSFTRNGHLLAQASINRIRPSSDIYPAISIVGDNKVAIAFDDSSFRFPPIASKFKMIICSSSII